MHVQAATKSDIPAIMRVERTEGYTRLVGRSDTLPVAILLSGSLYFIFAHLF